MKKRKQKQTLKYLSPMRIAEGEEIEFEVQEFPPRRIRVKMLEGGIIEVSGQDSSILVEPRYANVVRIKTGER